MSYPEPRSQPPPFPLFTIMAYVLGSLSMGWALWASYKEMQVPGNDFASITIPAMHLIGLVAAIFFGLMSAMLGYSRGEAKAVHALCLVPVLAMIWALAGTIGSFLLF